VPVRAALTEFVEEGIVRADEAASPRTQAGLVIMRFSPRQDAAEEMLLERMRQLHDQLDDKQIHSVECRRVSAEIRDLSKAYGKLTDARQGIGRPDPKT
jgi:hypothetical protein